MKKLTLSFFGIVALLFVGCKSTPAMLADRAPIAVISVTGNQSLPWLEPANATVSDDDEDDGTGVISTLVNKVLNGKDPELQTAQDRVDYAVDSFHHLLVENGGAEVIDADALLASRSYDYLSENIFSILDTSINATGYKNLMTLGAKNARGLMQENGAKSLIMADFMFRKTLVSGSKRRGQVAAHVVMKLRYLDEQGRELINHEYTAVSATTIPITSSKYDKDELIDLFTDAIDAVINQFIVANI